MSLSFCRTEENTQKTLVESLVEVTYCLARTNMADASLVEETYCFALTNIADASLVEVT